MSDEPHRPGAARLHVYAATIPVSSRSIAKKRFDKTLSAAFLAVTLVSAGGCASTASHQSTGEYFDDTVITTKVKTAIVEDPLTKVLDIKVTTYNGEVQLSGFVSSQAEADRAVELARGVEGVKSVKNDMQMK